MICVTAEFYLYDGYSGCLIMFLGGGVEEGDVWSGCLEVFLVLFVCCTWGGGDGGGGEHVV